jgi:hypothetical protein
VRFIDHLVSALLITSTILAIPFIFLLEFVLTLVGAPLPRED